MNEDSICESIATGPAINESILNVLSESWMILDIACHDEQVECVVGDGPVAEFALGHAAVFSNLPVKAFLWTTLEGEHCFTVLAFADPDADRSLCGKPVAVTFCPDDEQSDRDDDGDDNPWHDWSIILPRGCGLPRRPSPCPLPEYRERVRRPSL